MTEELDDEKRTWYLKGYAQAEADLKEKVTTAPTTVVLDGIPTQEDAIKTFLILEWFSNAIGLDLHKEWNLNKSHDGYSMQARINL